MDNAQATQEAFKAIKLFLDSEGLKYEESGLTLCVTIAGGDFPVTLYFSQNPELARIETFSDLTLEVNPEKTIDLARAASFINGRTSGGKFCLDLSGGRKITYDDTASVEGLKGFSSAFAKDIVGTAYTVISMYSDKLYAINKGLLTYKEFAARDRL